MKRLMLLIMCAVLALGLCACGEQMPTDNDGKGQPVAADEEAKTKEITEQLQKALQLITDLATEAPDTLLRGYIEGVEIDHSVTIDGYPYYGTTADYSELVDFYGQVFSGDALEWILSTQFINVEGKLYCGMAGGATGVNICDVSIEKNGENSYRGTFYEVSFDRNTESSCNFTVEETEAGYKISDIDYFPYFLKRIIENREEITKGSA